MGRNIICIILLFQVIYGYSQNDHNAFFYKPFSIYSSSSQVVVAGDLSTYVYPEYFGKDVKNERYSDPHAKPEYLIYELFKAMKIQDINSIDKLYDTSFKRKNFEPGRMAALLKAYNDVKFVSKFRSGDQLIVRYNFVASTKQYAYFAALRKIGNSYYLTSDINISDPFNLIGSLSPDNLFERKQGELSTNSMIPFYFISRDNKVFYSDQLPKEDHSVLYLAFEFYKKSTTSAEASFIKDLQNAAASSDSLKLKDMIAKDQLPLLSDPYLKNYYYSEIRKIFTNYPDIVPLAAIKTNDGKILYFNYAGNGQSSNIASIILKETANKYYLSLRLTNDDLNNILQNVYVREAILNYFRGLK